MQKRIDSKQVPVLTGSRYPSPFNLPCAARARQRLADVAGLTDFGVNLLRLPSGVWSNQRSQRDAVLLEVGSRRPGESGAYPDIDLQFSGECYLHRDGTPY